MSSDGSTWNPDWTNIPDGNDEDSLPNNETQYEVTGLLNDTAYTFQVRAVNSVGSSDEPASEESTPQAKLFITELAVTSSPTSGEDL